MSQQSDNSTVKHITIIQRWWRHKIFQKRAFELLTAYTDNQIHIVKTKRCNPRPAA